MPFGLDLKSLLVGILLAWFVIPFVQSKLLARNAPVTAKVG